jgi:hypothetical protein
MENGMVEVTEGTSAANEPFRCEAVVMVVRMDAVSNADVRPMRKALTILLFSVLTLQTAMPVQSVSILLSIGSSFNMGLEEHDPSIPSLPCEDPGSEGEVPMEESEDCHTPPFGSIPSLAYDSEDVHFPEPSFASIPTPVIDELKPPPQA